MDFSSWQPVFTAVQAWGDIWTVMDHLGRNVFEIERFELVEQALVTAATAGSLEGMLVALGFDPQEVQGP